MKILYHHRIRSKDGQYVHLEELVGALRRRGHEVCVVGPAAMEETAFGSDAGLVAWLKRHLPQALYELAEWGYDRVAYRRLAKAVAAFRPDVLYERYNLFLTAGVRAKRRFGLPMLLEVNAPLFDERKAFGGIALESLARGTERAAWRGADVVLPVTRVLADTVQREAGGDVAVAIVPNGINVEHFAGPFDTAAVRRRWRLDGKLVLGFTGFVRDWHALDRVVDAIAQDPPDHPRVLLVVGDGPARAALEAQAGRLGVSSRVIFTGVVPRADVPAHVASFDIALQPAVVAYASPLKLFEYLALGRAIVAPSTPNIREVLEHERNALLFDAESPAAMVAAIERLTADAALRARLSAGARATIAERGFTWDRNAERVTALFERLLQAQAGGAPVASSVASASFADRGAA